MFLKSRFSHFFTIDFISIYQSIFAKKPRWVPLIYNTNFDVSKIQIFTLFYYSLHIYLPIYIHKEANVGLMDIYH